MNVNRISLVDLEQHSAGEEFANAWTHGVGVALAIAGLSVLVTRASLGGDPWRVVSFSIYGATLVLLYLASTLYHATRAPKRKELFRVFDHSAIYLLIAGTYTPFMLVTLRGGWGWSLFGVSWGMAIVGVVVTALFMDRLRLVSVAAYVVMGWLIVIAIKPLLEALPAGAVAWIVAGGVTYTAGIAFYAIKRVPYHHTIWHVFVLAGSVFHFVGILLYVCP